MALFKQKILAGFSGVIIGGILSNYFLEKRTLIQRKNIEQMTSNDKSISIIQDLLATEFERDLFNAGITYISNTKDPLRFNSFSFSIRELFRHILTRLSPNEKVVACSWFKPVTETKQPSRGQKITYAIQGGLSHKFIEDELSFIYKDDIKEILTNIDLLSKFTHVNEKTFNIKNDKCDEYVENILDSLILIIELITSINYEIKEILHDYIEGNIISIFSDNVFEDLDILSSQTYAESSSTSSHNS